MTSRISYSKLSKENRKRNLGIALVTALAFFVKAVLFVMGMKNRESYDDIIDLLRPNVMMAGVVIGIAVVSAASTLYYLHSRRQTDFYESIPIKRETLFKMAIQNSLLVFLIPLVVEEAIEFVVAGRQILGGGVFAVGEAILWYLLIFAATWLTMALAMIMTGNIIVGVLGFGVFATYFPIVIYNIFPLYAGSFFSTYSGDTANSVYNSITNYLSPIWIGLRGIAYVNEGTKSEITFLALLLVWCVALYILCQALYGKRPAESAGRAMAFPKANTVIKVLLVIPSALYSGFIFYSLGDADSIFWLVFGVVFGAIVVHALIECIYQFNVKAAFSNKKHLVFVMICSLFIMGSFTADIFGYDRYVPEASKLESVTVKPSNTNTYGYWGKGQEGLTGDAMKLALSAIKESVEVKNNSGNTEGSSSYYESSGSFFFKTISRKEVTSSDIDIFATFRTKNGSLKTRNYTLRSEKAKELYNKLYTTREFKSELYSLYTGDYNEIKEISWSGINTAYLNLTKEEKKQFFDTYLSEFDELTYTDIQNIVPIGSIDISVGGTAESMDAIQDSYYIYPSFKKTIAFLKQKGCAADQTIADLNISSLDVTKYDDSTGDNVCYTITNKNVIDKVKDKLVLQQMSSVSGLDTVNTNTDIDIQVNYKSKNGESTVACFSTADDAEMEKLLQK